MLFKTQNALPIEALAKLGAKQAREGSKQIKNFV
jgi:hypothetical protein